MRHEPIARNARYLMVGGTCAAAHNGLMIGGDLLGVHYLVLNGVSLLLVTPLGYLLHSHYTFGKRRSLRRLARFTAGILSGFLLCLAIMALLCSGFGVRPMIASPIATLILFFWNYASAYWAIIGRTRAR